MIVDQMKYVLMLFVIFYEAFCIVPAEESDDQITISEMTAVTSIIYQMPINCSTINGTSAHYIIQKVTPPESIFQIDQNGRIKLMSMLDAERQQNYEVLISNQAVNWTLKIQVTDENDNSPVFQRPIYELTFQENTPLSGTTGLLIANVIAKDSDISTANRMITYGLMDNSTTGFYITSNGDIYSSITFDYETQKQYKFIITATNIEPTIKLTGFALVIVNILDVNDNRPVFYPVEYSFTTVANVIVGAIIGVVQATDADSGINGAIHYIIEPDYERGTTNVPFKVLSRGEIVTTSPMQRGFVYYFAVIATDSSAVNRAYVVVQAVDQTQNLTSVIVLNVSESLPGGYLIYGKGAIEEIDDSIQFTISPPGMEQKFTFLGGRLYLRERLDYETQKIFQFNVSTSHQSQEFLVLVTDTNDEKPIVSISPTYVRMTTNYPVGSVVAVAHVNDPDTGNVIKYRIVSGDPTNIFSINDQGLIQTVRCLSNAAVQFTMLMVNVSDGIHTVSKSIPLQIFRSTDKNFENNCGVDCNPVSISLTSTAQGNISFSNVVQNGRQLNISEIEQIVSNPNGTNYVEIQSGIRDALIGFFEKRYLLTSLEVTMLSLVSTLRQRRATQRSGYLNAEYVFTIKTTDASLPDLNPIKQNETIQFNDTSAFVLQTNENLSTVSDVDECKSEKNICDLNAYCMIFPNTIAYACQCKDGYTGDGYSCKQKESVEMDKKVVIGVAVGAAVLVIAMVIVVVMLCKNKIRYQNDLKRLNAIQSVQLVDKKNGNTNPAYK